MKVICRSTPLSCLLILLISFTVSCGSSRRAIAIEEGWDLISEQKVNFVRDKDVITVNSRNLYTDLRFRVEDREVRINELKIFFPNGDKLEPRIDEVIQPDQYSRIIEITRDGRAIDHIEFKYRTTGNLLKGRANVLVFGRRYDARWRDNY